MSIVPKIPCNGIKPKKSEVYKLAAELVELESIRGFNTAVIEALKSYDYAYYDYYDYDDYYDYYDYDQDYDYYYDYYDHDYDYYAYYSIQEKVIALLFLSAMYAELGD